MTTGMGDGLQSFTKMERSRSSTYNAWMEIWGIFNSSHYKIRSISQINVIYLSVTHSKITP